MPPTPDKSSAAYHKRREQVRRAQRTHRERKESYVKALEDKVVQLRAREESARSANEALRCEVARLRGVVGAPALMGMGVGTGGAGLGQWGNVEGGGGGSGGVWETELVASGYGNESLNSYSRGDADMDVVVWDESSRVDSVEGFEGDVGEHWASPPRLGSGSPYSLHSSCGLGPKAKQTDLALEFVLDLEKPCIQRAQSAVFDPANSVPSSQFDQFLGAGPSGYHYFLEEHILDTNTSPQDETAGRLGKLLALSEGFELDNKVTPVQAWQMLCTHPDFGAVDIRTVRRLVRGMMEYVVCYGFGAVIETSAFDKVCRAMFTNGGH